MKYVKAKKNFPHLFCSSSNINSVYQQLKRRHFQLTAEIKRGDTVVRITNVQSLFS